MHMCRVPIKGKLKKEAEHVAQLHEEDALLVAVQLGQRHAERTDARGLQAAGRPRVQARTDAAETDGSCIFVLELHAASVPHTDL
jgi:hypothetical protein